MICHAGDLMSLAVSQGDWNGARQRLKTIRTKYQAIRVWSVLSFDYWEGRYLGPDRQGQSAYWDGFDQFCQMCREEDVKIVLSQGDLWASRTDPNRFGDDLRGRLDPSLFIAIDAGNEAWQTGLGEDAGRGARWLGRLQTSIIKSITSPQEDNVDENAPLVDNVRHWAQSPADVRDSHAAFGDDRGCVRRTFNAGYEPLDQWEEGPGVVFLSEPRGYGRNVSVHQINRTEHIVAQAAAGLIGGGVPFFMSSEGVISNGTGRGGFDGGEGFENMRGFAEVSDFIRSLPPQILSAKTVCHGGTRWAGTQWFRVHNDDSRANQCITADGQAFCLADGQVEHVRGTIDRTEQLGDFVFYQGRV